MEPSSIFDFEIEPLDISELQDRDSESEEQEEDLEGPDAQLADPYRQSEVRASESDKEERCTGKSSENSETSVSASSSDKETTSQNSSINSESTVFVKLRLPYEKVLTFTACPKISIHELKEKISQTFHIPQDIIELWKHSPQLLCEEKKEISHYGLLNGNLELHLHITDPEINILQLSAGNIIAPVDIITVDLNNDERIVVEIENKIERKFLGGYRCTKTGKEYLHSETQTRFMVSEGSAVKYSRTSQTHEISDCSQQTYISKETQTNGIDDSSKMCDKQNTIINPRTCEIDQFSKSALKIQRYWRGYRARKLNDMQVKSSKVVSPGSPAQREQHGHGGSLSYTPQMFEVLYQLVEQWRKKCLRHAAASKTEGPTRADFQDILEMQVHLLRIIEKERIKMRHELKKEKEQKLLEQCCSPIRWKGYRGLTISMETVHSQRAIELKKLYDLLTQQNKSILQRKEDLNTIQAALKSQKSHEGSEIINLINRELQLLSMGLGKDEVDTLHRRIEKLFATLISNPLHQNNKTMDPYYMCVQCKKMLPPTSFIIPLNKPAIKLCASCHWIDNISHKRVDHNPYQLILRDLRNAESKRGCYNSLAFILQTQDVRYLVDQIWHGQSAISQCAELRELRLERWDVTHDWSPWNTVLLTIAELRDHLAIPHLQQVYGHDFIRNIKVKHLMAQMHYKCLEK